MAVLKDLVVIGPARVTGPSYANSFVKAGGTSSQFLKADGSVDSNSYALATSIPTVNNATLTIAASGLTLSTDPTFTANASAAKTITITHPTATAYSSGFYKVTVNATGHVTAAAAVTASDITSLVTIPSFSALGSSIKPVYLSAANTFTACSQYAGGTAVTLNGTSKAANTASFYAPTSVGSSGQYLKSNGSGAPSWSALPAASTHTLLSSDVHTDTITGSPTNGNIIVGNGTKWTSQSFETFANTYHAVPLVGHFDTTNFNAWFQACVNSVMNSGMFYDDVSAVRNANPSLNWITIDISISDIISAITSGRPVYMLGTATIDGLSDFKFVFQPNVDIVNGGTTHGIIFSSSCGFDFIGGIDVAYQTNADGNGNPGGGLILLPRLTGENMAKLGALPSNSGAIAYKPIYTGSDTTTFLRNDGIWATPDGGGGGTADGNYYPTAVTWVSGASAGPKPKLTMSGVSDITGDAVPSASSTASGIVTNKGQTFGGVKTFAASPKLSTNIITTSGGYSQTFPNASGTVVNGTGTSGYIAKWNGTNSITNGPQFGSSTSTFLRNDGSWAAPAGGGSQDMATAVAQYNSSASTTGKAIYTATVSNVQRNAIFINIDSTEYAAHFNANTQLWIDLNTPITADNYVFVRNFSGHTLNFTSTNITSGGTVPYYILYPEDNNGDNPLDDYGIINMRTTLIGITFLDDQPVSHTPMAVVTFGGRFNEDYPNNMAS